VLEIHNELSFDLTEKKGGRCEKRRSTLPENGIHVLPVSIRQRPKDDRSRQGEKALRNIYLIPTVAGPLFASP